MLAAHASCPKNKPTRNPQQQRLESLTSAYGGLLTVKLSRALYTETGLRSLSYRCWKNRMCVYIYTYIYREREIDIYTVYIHVDHAALFTLIFKTLVPNARIKRSPWVRSNLTPNVATDHRLHRHVAPANRSKAHAREIESLPSWSWLLSSSSVAAIGLSCFQELLR